MPDTYNYSLTQVSALTGVPKQTLDSWERRYGLFEPHLIRNNRRLYSNRQVGRIRLLRDCIKLGNRIGSLVGLTDEQLQRLLNTDLVHAVQTDKFMHLIEEMKAKDLEADLGLHLLAMGPTLFMEELVAPVMRKVGDKWEDGSLPVAAEHLVTSAVRTLLVTAMRMVSRRGAQKLALFLTVEDEQHELGLLGAALVMAKHGLEPLYLGTSVPYQEIPRAVAKTGAVAVAIGTTMSDTGRIVRQMDCLKEKLPTDVRILVGGCASEQSTKASIPGLAVFSSISELDVYLDLQHVR